MHNLRFLIWLVFSIIFFGCSQENGQFETREIIAEKSETANSSFVDTINNVHISGKVNNGPNVSLVLEANTPGGVVQIAKGYSDKQGYFELKGNIRDFGLYQLRIEEQLQSGQEPKVIPLTLEIGDSLVLETFFETFAVNPTYSNTRWSASLNGYMKEMTDFVNWQKTIDNPQKYNQQELMSMILQKKKSMDDFSIKCIGEDPGNPANILLITNLFPNMGWEYWNAGYLKYLKQVHKAYEIEFPGHPMTNNLGTQIAQLDKSYEEYVNFSEKNMAPDIQLKDPTGKLRRLSDLRGKIVLIDFWASWCKPCRMENPNVVKLYTEYKSQGFEVFSVSLDNQMDPWLKAIELDNLYWENHVSDLGGWNSMVVPLYKISGIPHTVLIDKSGKILGVNLRGVQLEQKLKDVFK